MKITREKMRNPDALGDYLSDLLQLDPHEFVAADPSPTNWSSVATHALLLEGDDMNVALPLDAFGGIALRQHNPDLQVIPISELAQPEPQAAVISHRLVIKLREHGLGISCRRAERVISLTEQCVFRNDADDRPWLGGIVKEDWALVLNVRGLAQALVDENALAGTKPASNHAAPAMAPDI